MDEIAEVDSKDERGNRSRSKFRHENMVSVKNKAKTTNKKGNENKKLLFKWLETSKKKIKHLMCL